MRARATATARSGLIHSLWKPMPGRFKDYIAMPKFNNYRALHTTVIGPQGRPLEIQVRTREMHATAEYGVAAHWLYKGRRKQRDDEWTAWVKQLMDVGTDEADPREFMKSFRTDLFEDEVHVFTPKGQVKTLPAGSTPIDFAYAVHTDVGHRTVGAKVNGRIVPLHYRLKNGDFVEILTSKQGRGPSRDWLSLAKSSRARNKIRQWYSRETREDQEQKGREALEQALKQQNLPYAKLRGSSVLAQVIRDSGFKKAEDFYVALGSGKLSAGSIVNKVIQRLKTDEVAEEAPVDHEGAARPRRRLRDRPRHRRAGRRRRSRPAREVLHPGAGRSHRGVHLARQGDHDPPRRLPEREGAQAKRGALHAGRVGRRRHEVVPRADRRQLVGSPTAARGRGADVCRARREHRQLRRERRGSAREELVHGRGRRREGAPLADERPALARLGVRRLPRDALIEAREPTLHPDAYSFAGVAELYERVRPEYPDEAVDWLVGRLGLEPGRVVVDLAAGTGKLTRRLVPSGARVVAVEPLPEMRAQLERIVPAADIVPGTAEELPLPDASADAVTVGQAFHWFDPEPAIAEIARVLRPGGALAPVWNIRDLSDPFQAELDELLLPVPARDSVGAGAALA